jgi:hypothetical protein
MIGCLLRVLVSLRPAPLMVRPPIVTLGRMVVVRVNCVGNGSGTSSRHSGASDRDLMPPSNRFASGLLSSCRKILK